MEEPMLQQIYYCSLATGLKAVKYIKILHNEMIEEAKSRGLNYCMSPGSHEDADRVFVRILERQGWQIRGYLAVKKL